MRSAALVGLLGLPLAVLPARAAGAAGPPSIAMVSSGDAGPFWQDVMRGAQKAARDYGATVSFESLADESTPDAQSEAIRAALARNPSALCIDALDGAKVPPLLERARRQRIPVIGFDAIPASPLLLSTVATDNVPAAALAANKIAALMGGSGTVGLIVRDQTSRSSVERRDGFLAEIARRYPDVHVATPQYSGGDAHESAELAKAMIQATPEITGLFCGDEGSAAGALSAVQELGRAGKIIVVGFDSGKAQLDAIRDGIEAGAVTQDPIRIGYKTVETAVATLNGRRVPKRIDSGFHWYDATNIDDPGIAVLLHP